MSIRENLKEDEFKNKIKETLQKSAHLEIKCEFPTFPANFSYKKLKLEGLHEESEDDKNSAKRNLKESSNDEYEEQLKRSNKGRKREFKVVSTKGLTMKDLIKMEVIPKWKQQLTKISAEKREACLNHKGEEYVWLEIFKDIRKFYRLIFRVRFHRNDKRNDDNSMTLVKTFVKEMGFYYEPEEINRQLFSFLYISFTIIPQI